MRKSLSPLEIKYYEETEMSRIVIRVAMKNKREVCVKYESKRTLGDVLSEFGVLEGKSHSPHQFKSSEPREGYQEPLGTTGNLWSHAKFVTCVKL